MTIVFQYLECALKWSRDSLLLFGREIQFRLRWWRDERVMGPAAHTYRRWQMWWESTNQIDDQLHTICLSIYLFSCRHYLFIFCFVTRTPVAQIFTTYVLLFVCFAGSNTRHAHTHTFIWLVINNAFMYRLLEWQLRRWENTNAYARGRRETFDRLSSSRHTHTGTSNMSILSNRAIGRLTEIDISTWIRIIDLSLNFELMSN